MRAKYAANGCHCIPGEDGGVAANTLRKSTGVEAAEAAGLHYVTDSMPGISRLKSGIGFRYRDAKRRPIKDRKVLERIRKLAIPPAYRHVWICPDPKGHLQATGIDARGRKQYRYHPAFRQVEEEEKFHRLEHFGRFLPELRQQVESDLGLRGLPKDKVVAMVVRLMDRSLVRVGNQEYARSNRSYGLTTMRMQHLRLKGSTMLFSFRGKSRVDHSIEVRDQRMARLVRKLQELPGQELFRYVDPSDRVVSVSSTDVNQYLHVHGGEGFTAKDFRTWGASVLALIELSGAEPAESLTGANRAIRTAMQRVSARLGNTPTICQKCYVHPAVLESFRERKLPSLLNVATGSPLELLETAEAALITLLRKR